MGITARQGRDTATFLRHLPQEIGARGGVAKPHLQPPEGGEMGGDTTRDMMQCGAAGFVEQGCAKPRLHQGQYVRQALAGRLRRQIALLPHVDQRIQAGQVLERIHRGSET